MHSVLPYKLRQLPLVEKLKKHKIICTLYELFISSLEAESRNVEIHFLSKRGKGSGGSPGHQRSQGLKLKNDIHCNTNSKL